MEILPEGANTYVYPGTIINYTGDTIVFKNIENVDVKAKAHGSEGRQFGS